jgi:hypothetical protein
MLGPGRTGRRRAGRVGRAGRGVWVELGEVERVTWKGGLVHVELYLAGGGRVVALTMAQGEITEADLVCTAVVPWPALQINTVGGQRATGSHAQAYCMVGVQVIVTWHKAA